MVGCQTNESSSQIINELEDHDSQYVEEGEKSVIYEDLETLVADAQFIVVGEVEGLEDYAIDGTKYKVKITQQLKGKLEEDVIDVYERPNDMKINQTVLLFLEGWESEFYPEPLFNALDESIMIIKNQDVKGNEKFLKDNLNLKNNLIKFIQKEASSKSIKVEKRKVRDKVTSEEELINLSDYVVVLRPTEQILKNNNVKLVKIEILEKSI